MPTIRNNMSLKRWLNILLAVGFTVAAVSVALNIVTAVHRANFPNPDSVSMRQFLLAAEPFTESARVDEKLFIDRDSWGVIFYGEIPEKDLKRFQEQESTTNSRPRRILRVHSIGRENLISVGRRNDKFEKRWKEIVSFETARQRQKPKVMGRDILDSDSKILGVQFGQTTTFDLTKEFGPATVSDGSIQDSLQTWSLKGLVIATDGRSSPSPGGAKVDLVSAMAWSGSLNEALTANDIKPLPIILGSLRVGQTRAEVERLLKASPRDGNESMTSIMIRQAGEKSVFGWVTWSHNQRLRSIQFSDSWE